LLQDALEQLSRFAVMAEEPAQNPAVPAELFEENGRLKRRVADLLQVSRMDALTGICNRAWFLQQFVERAALHRVRNQSIGMAVVDIDHFKKVNDTYGHQAGDLALKVVADTLKLALRDDDLVGRYGGEEFVIQLEDANPEGLQIVGERLRSKIENAVVVFDGKRIPITASIGLVHGPVVGTEQEFAESLFAFADAAMYRAKKSGRNCIVIDELRAGSNSPTPALALA
jgi:diguanylate cyclase (GGDEF)-like protein